MNPRIVSLIVIGGFVMTATGAAIWYGQMPPVVQTCPARAEDPQLEWCMAHVRQEEEKPQDTDVFSPNGPMMRHGD